MLGIKRVLFVSLFFLSACDVANQNSIFRTTEVTDGKITFVDAKQRAILSNRAKRQTKVPVVIDGKVTDMLVPSEEVITQYCAEPSPDALSALSSSISLSASLSQDQKASAAFQLARSVNESAASIGLRTQTITVLRDMMYRLCERYMNGAINKDEFTIQAGRDQRIIVSVLAIEQLTGAVQPRTVIVGANSAASAGENIGITQAQLDATRKDLKEAETQLETDNKTLEDAETAKVEADKIKTSMDNTATGEKYTVDEIAAVVETAKKTVSDAKSVVDVSTLKVEDRKKNVTALKAQLVNLRDISASGQTVGLVVPENMAPEGSITAVSSAVKDIVTMTFKTDEVTLACLGQVRNGLNPEDFCDKYLKRQQAEEKLKLDQLNFSIKEEKLKSDKQDLVIKTFEKRKLFLEKNPNAIQK